MSLITGINPTKWLATQPVASSRVNTLTNSAWVLAAARRGRAPSRWPVRTFDEVTDLLPISKPTAGAPSTDRRW